MLNIDGSGPLIAESRQCLARVTLLLTHSKEPIGHPPVIGTHTVVMILSANVCRLASQSGNR